MKYTYQYANDYREELKILRKQYKKLIKGKEIMKERLISKASIELEEELSRVESNAKIVSSMISSTEYALFWIENGFEQGAYEKRPITNANKQIRTQLWGDVENAPSIKVEESGNELSEEEQALIKDMLDRLPEIERLVYFSIYGKGNTHEQTAQYVGIPRNSITYRLNKAQRLIDHQLLYGQLEL